MSLLLPTQASCQSLTSRPGLRAQPTSVSLVRYTTFLKTYDINYRTYPRSYKFLYYICNFSIYYLFISKKLDFKTFLQIFITPF
ncbi:hypothetical protein EHQ93_11690 [Leptospira meyeri]|nr:hypothetical protein EHQ93_11690 [Leptospira meyeri]